MTKIPQVLGPFDRNRVTVDIDPETGLTHQSFKDECDITRIVETYARTGIIPAHRLEPHYGEAPDADLFEAACSQAAIRTAVEDGWEAPEPTNPEEQGSDGTDPVTDPEPSPEGSEPAAEG